MNDNTLVKTASWFVAAGLTLFFPFSSAAEDTGELAKKSANPISSVISLPIQLSSGGRYWADSLDGGPENWGGRLQFTFIFPK